MPEFANDGDTFAIPRRPSVGWLKKVCAAAGVWPDAETVPDAVWNAALLYQEGMRKVQGATQQQAAPDWGRALELLERATKYTNNRTAWSSDLTEEIAAFLLNAKRRPHFFPSASHVPVQTTGGD